MAVVTMEGAQGKINVNVMEAMRESVVKTVWYYIHG